jgi:hypothetical protein
MRLGKLNITFGRGSSSGPTTSEQPGAGPAASSRGSGVDPVAAGSVLRGYGPLAAFGVLFVLMAALVPSVDDRVDTTGFTAAGGQTGGNGGTYDPGGAGAGDGTGSGSGSGSGSGRGSGGGGSVGGAGQGESAAPGGPVSGPVSGPTDSNGPAVQPQEGRGEGSCAGRDLQVPGNPYSPPCMEFEGGSNGGETYRGVHPGKIVVAARMINERGFQQTLAAIAGAEIVDSPADIQRTIKVLEEFFNKHYQFWGRKLEIQFHDGRSSTIEELQGRNQAEAQADAKHVAQTMKAFAELNGATEPYIRSLAGQKTIGIGTPYLSRKWHQDYRPYAWSFFTDCSIVAETAAEVVYKMLSGKQAEFAGSAYQDTTRKFGGLAPENPWYQECQDAFLDILGSKSIPREKINYKLDLNSMSNQAANVVAKLKSQGVTSVLCGCDPIFPVFLTSKAAEQNYEPEWIHIGTAFTDIDIVGQLYDQDQWSRAFGVSALGSPRPVRGGLGYSAYKSIRSDEPAFAVEFIFGSMTILANGIQMAGPTLNPETFAQGLFKWPGGSGPYGTWGFSEGNFTPTRDYRVTYWNRNVLSIENNRKGAYVEAFDGKRYPPGSLPQMGDQQPPVLTADPNYQGG